MSTAAIAPTPKRRMIALFMLPLLLVGLGILEASGNPLTAKAGAADPTDNVVVTGTVGANLSVSTGCADVDSFTIDLGAVSYSNGCAITFGANNDSTTYLSVHDSDGGNFLGTIGDTAASCAAMADAGDAAGIKITTKNAQAAYAAAWGGAGCVSAADTNDDFKAVPDAAARACDGTDNTASCTFQWGVIENGSNLGSGTYQGTAVFTNTNY